MSCIQCGHHNDEAAKFCEKCGASLARCCTSCDAELRDTANFCPGCGAKIESAEPPQVSRPSDSRSSARSGYTPPHLAEKILTSRSALEGEIKQVTVLFVDVKGSMELAARLDAESWHEVLDGFCRILADGIHRFEGTINQYTGDGVMALFGAPIAHEDHAQRACFAVLHLREVLRDYADELKRKHGFGFLARMGMNSGQVVVGKIGDDLRMDYTAQGHTVGLAQRMEQLASPGEAYMTDETEKLVKGYFETRALGAFEVKGSDAAVEVFELQGRGEAKTRLDLARQRGLSRFVGRQDEMGVLEHALEESIAGRGQVVGVVADAGVGKSRLCDEFVSSCRAKGVAVYAGHCPAHGKTIPHIPVLEMFRGYLGISERDDDQTARERVAGKLLLMDQEFGEFVDPVLNFLGIGEADGRSLPLDSSARQRQFLGFLQRLIKTRSVETPAIIFLDDLHWIDSGSDEIVTKIVEVVNSTRTLVLVNFRPEYTAEWMRMSFYRQIPLVPLGPEAIARLASEFLGSHSSVSDLPELIGNKTGGNPFFTEEVLLSLVESGRLEGEKGAYVLTAPIEEIAITQQVHSLIAARIDRLDDREKRVLQAAAVIGREFSEPLLAKIACLSDEDLAGALDKLKSAELIYEQSLYPDVEYAFRHPLTHEVAHDSQLAAHRTAMHARVARAIEDTQGEGPGEHAPVVARHWELGGEPIRAAHWYARSLARWSASDRKIGITQVTKILDLVPNDVDSEEFVDLRMQACLNLLCIAGWQVGLEPGRAQALYDEGKAHGARRGDSRYLTELAIAFAPTRGIGHGEIEEYVEWGQEVIRLAEQTGDPELIGPALVIGSYSNQCFGRIEESLRLCHMAGEVAGGNLTVGINTLGLSVHAWSIITAPFLIALLGRLSEAKEMAPSGIEAARAGKSDSDLTFALCGVADLECMSGRIDKGEEIALEALEVAEKAGTVFGQIYALTQLARVRNVVGKWRESIEVSELAADLIRRYGTGLESEPHVLCDLGAALMGAERLDDARATLDEALDLARRRQARLAELGLYSVCAHLEIVMHGAQSGARVEELLAKADRLIEETGAVLVRPSVLVERARFAEVSGDNESRDRYYREAERLFAEYGATGFAVGVREKLAESG